MQLSVEMYVEEKGLVRVNRGYLRDSKIELADLLRWTKTQLITISYDVLMEEQAKGFDKTPLILVDGSRTKKVSDVNPLGQIRFVSRQNIADVLLAAYESLLRLSKVKTGRYKDSHYIFLNGIQVATDLNSLKTWLAGIPEIKVNDLVRIVNIQPYGRRLELLGVTSERQKARVEDKGRRKGIKTGILLKKPNGAYQLTSRKIKTKYKNNVSIKFTFIPGSELGLSGYRPEHHHRFVKGRPGKNSAGRTYLYPTLVFKINSEGLY